MTRCGWRCLVVAVVTLALGLIEPGLPLLAAAGGTASPAPDRGSIPGTLTSVTCVSEHDCWAVGMSGAVGVWGLPPLDLPALNLNYDTLPVTRTLALHWDGAVWSQVSTPNPSHWSELNGVSCVSPTVCWAVGWATPDMTPSPTAATVEILRWNGNAWTAL